MKKWDIETINGERFEVNHVDTYTTAPHVNTRDIDDCYGRPSSTKLRIFNEWSNWFLNNDGYCGVYSYNSNIFTITGVVVDKETQKLYYCYITPSHNKAWEIVG